MDRDKENQVSRYLKSFERGRVRRDNNLQRGAKAGKPAARGRRARPFEEWDEDEDHEVFERIKKPSEGSPKRRVAPPLAEAADKLVVGVDAGRILVEVNGEEVKVRVPPGSAARGALAVGDFVALKEVAGAPPHVVAVGPRRNALTRTDPANPNELRVIAANLDLAVIVLAPLEGRVREGMADRVRVALARHAVDDLLVVNKTDLMDAERSAELDERIVAHAAHGRQAIAVSAHTGRGLEALRSAIAGRTVAFVGPSGVGKSTLLNALDPGCDRATAAIREKDGRGRHTTTSSRLVRLPGGARWIDTPGVRQFGLGPIDLDELRAAFPELLVAASSCRYSDCRHLGEEHCAVEERSHSDEHLGERLGAWRRILQGD